MKFKQCDKEFKVKMFTYFGLMDFDNLFVNACRIKKIILRIP